MSLAQDLRIKMMAQMKSHDLNGQKNLNTNLKTAKAKIPNYLYHLAFFT
jgi:hypothetical protein